MEIIQAPSINRVLTEQELERVKLHEEVTMTELQVFLRDLLTILSRDKRFICFSNPIDTELDVKFE